MILSLLRKEFLTVMILTTGNYFTNTQSTERRLNFVLKDVLDWSELEVAMIFFKTSSSPP